MPEIFHPEDSSPPSPDHVDEAAAAALRDEALGYRRQAGDKELTQREATLWDALDKPVEDTVAIWDSAFGASRDLAQLAERFSYNQPASPAELSEPAPDISERQPLTSTGDRVGLPEWRGGRRLTGSEFVDKVLGVSRMDGPYANGLRGAARERAILEQIEIGNVPDFLRHPKTVVVRDRRGNVAELKVMPDYLAVGTNEDYVRIPVTPLLAKTIAERYGLQLPTRKLVDDIYRQSDVRLAAVGLVQSGRDQNYMQGNGFYLKHDDIVDRSLGTTTSDLLVAGHKKDIIISRYALTHPDRLDFYGFFDGNGRPIQGAGGGPHENTYVDYSHGVRFISQEVIVNGTPMRFDDVLRDPALSGLLSDEGAFDPTPIYRRPALPGYQALVNW